MLFPLSVSPWRNQGDTTAGLCIGNETSLLRLLARFGQGRLRRRVEAALVGPNLVCITGRRCVVHMGLVKPSGSAASDVRRSAYKSRYRTDKFQPEGGCGQPIVSPKTPLLDEFAILGTLKCCARRYVSSQPSLLPRYPTTVPQ